MAFPISDGIPQNWADSLIHDEVFAQEQARLAHVWTFLGLASDVANDGDWFRASLATRSVFVQRFGNELKGFENRCAHRFYPLRTTDKGNGPVVCGFHHWRYDREGRAIGIPICEEVFGRTPRELGAKLVSLDIATCGNLVFGRFPSPDAAASLEQYLDQSFPIIEAMSRWQEKPQRLMQTVDANWRLCYHISLEDYHLAAVHPATFGKIGYLTRDNLGYFRVGEHAAFFTNSDPDGVPKMAAACRDGVWRSQNYRIFHIFPNFAISHFQADGQHWFINILQYIPLAKNRSLMRSWIYRAPFPANLPWYERWIEPFIRPFRAVAVRFGVKRVLNEDNEICERWQARAEQLDTRPILGRLEERIAWFEETYSKVRGGIPEKATDAAG